MKDFTEFSNSGTTKTFAKIILDSLRNHGLKNVTLKKSENSVILIDIFSQILDRNAKRICDYLFEMFPVRIQDAFFMKRREDNATYFELIISIW